MTGSPCWSRPATWIPSMPGTDTDTLVLSGVVPGNHVVVVDLSSTTDQVVSIGGVADAPRRRSTSRTSMPRGSAVP